MTLTQAEMERRERISYAGTPCPYWLKQAHSRIRELESALRVQKRRADVAEEACSEAERALREQAIEGVSAWWSSALEELRDEMLCRAKTREEAVKVLKAAVVQVDIVQVNDYGRLEARRVLDRSEKDYGVPYLQAEVAVVHQHGCACTRWGKKSGPCNCGGDQLFQKWLKTKRLSDPTRKP